LHSYASDRVIRRVKSYERVADVIVSTVVIVAVAGVCLHWLF